MKKRHLQLAEVERAPRESLVQKGTLRAKAVKRATGLLERERGKTLQAVAETLGVNYNTVAAWRDADQVAVHGLLW